MGKKYYAVRKGRSTGVFTSWDKAKASVEKYPGAVFKSFTDAVTASSFVSAKGGYSASYDSGANISSNSSSGGSRVRSKSGACDASSSRYDLCSSSRYGFNNLKASHDHKSDLGMQKFSKNGNNVSYMGTGYTHSAHTDPVVFSRGISSTEYQDVYTDGASRGNGKVGAIAGSGVYFGPNDPRNLSVPLPGDRQTNQRAEQYAINQALQVILKEIKQNQSNETNITKIKPVRIYTDSKYSLSCLTEWNDRWEANGYKTSAGKDVENSDLIKSNIHLIREINKTYTECGVDSKVDIKHVPAHVGIHGNEAADRLANIGADLNYRNNQARR
ncbi:hypothetical protein NADFUDRAFT_49110 [Nadsonia fulvescens var. elongata DSM 6958]|uniref:Ribonuclease H n=1 Tax=Nadsonia fulvescens var. elongata DSM 6958 TaxID=857566 RepID=A0A1E3PU38_9ASCO|nr:hypothetical protein NADFUDRAFT_49110 [Nadsonia fulvescens var. elongata DSM 6958]